MIFFESKIWKIIYFFKFNLMVELYTRVRYEFLSSSNKNLKLNCHRSYI